MFKGRTLRMGKKWMVLIGIALAILLIPASLFAAVEVTERTGTICPSPQSESLVVSEKPPLVKSPVEHKFIPVGLGGGGAMFAPTSSPHDPHLMFVSSDMGGFFRSEDGGKSWTMIDWRIARGSTRCHPVFHPLDPKVIYFTDLISRDAGKTWEPILEHPPWSGKVYRLGIGPVGRLIFVAIRDSVYLSRDGGKSFTRCENVSGRAVGFYVSPVSEKDKRMAFIGTSEGVFRSNDDGVSWQKKISGLPWTGLRSFAGATSLGSKQPVLYCTIPSKKVGNEFIGGVFKSTDNAESWKSAMGDGINTRLGKVDEWGAGDIAQYFLLQVAEGHPDKVFVTASGTGYWPPNHSTVYRSENGGADWKAVFFYDHRFEEHNIEHGWLPRSQSRDWGGHGHMSSRFGGNSANPDIAMITNYGELHITTDGGKTWLQAYSTFAPGQPPPALEMRKRPGRWQSRGLEVTTTWNYYIDPFDSNRHFIAYTDIGMAISTDRGRTWKHGMKGSPWNNTYQMAFDPDVEGQIWAAMSDVHDIPHWRWIHDEVKGPGGVTVSTDGGETWTKSSKGLPNAPARSIILDPTSPKDARVLFVAVFGHGVFKSADGGLSWTARNKGIDLKANPHTWMVYRHEDGTLFLGTTGYRIGGRPSLKFAPTSPLYRSTDGGESWENITISLPLPWLNGFAVDPRDSKVIYIAAATIPGDRIGGIYKTTDGGESWKRLLKDEDFAEIGPPSFVHGMFVTIDPKRPDEVYLGSTHGLWKTNDAGKSWRFIEGIPFHNIHNVTFDPDDPELIYVTTFGGGVWRGPRPE